MLHFFPFISNCVNVNTNFFDKNCYFPYTIFCQLKLFYYEINKYIKNFYIHVYALNVQVLAIKYGIFQQNQESSRNSPVLNLVTSKKILNHKTSINGQYTCIYITYKGSLSNIWKKIKCVKMSLAIKLITLSNKAKAKLTFPPHRAHWWQMHCLHVVQYTLIFSLCSEHLKTDKYDLNI